MMSEKIWKRSIALFLVLIILSGISPVSVAAVKTTHKVGDIIEFGTYPQSEVVDNKLISSLNESAKSWTSYGYYTGTGDWHDGKMAASDFMQYTDVEYPIGSSRYYRGVKFWGYRPSPTGGVLTGNSDSNIKWKLTTTYWFAYEPLEWVVLDVDAGLILSKSIIDEQPYNSFILEDDKTQEDATYSYFSNAEKSHYASDYASSSVRQWLTDERDPCSFFNTAFNNEEQVKIFSTVLDNSSRYASQFNSVSTKDRVFLLSYSDVINISYGFNQDRTFEDNSRKAALTDYASCQGLEYSFTQYTDWYLRTPGTSLSVCCVYENGYVYDGDYYHYWLIPSSVYGIRPAMCVDLDRINSVTESNGVTVYATKKSLSFTLPTDGKNADPIGFLVTQKDGDTYTTPDIYVEIRDPSVAFVNSIGSISDFANAFGLPYNALPDSFKKGKYIVLKPKEIGSTIVTIVNRITDERIQFPIVIESGEPITIRANDIATNHYYIKGWADDYYNFYKDGVYVSDIDYRKEGNGYYFSMKIYNENSNPGVVEVFNSDGHAREAQIIKKFESATTGLYDLGEKFVYLVDDLVHHDAFSFRSSTTAEETIITDLYVPQDGMVRITLDSGVSWACAVTNYIDVIYTTNDLIKAVDGLSELDKGAIAGETIKEIIQNGAEKTAEKFSEKWVDEFKENITKQTANAIVTDFSTSLHSILDECDVDFKKVCKTAVKSSVSVAEKAFEASTAFIGQTLTIMFTSSRALNLLSQLWDMSFRSSQGAPITFFTPASFSGGQIIACDGVQVDTFNSVPRETVLRTYRVYRGDIDLPALNTCEDYIAYDISLISEGSTLQPSDSVRVTVPISFANEGDIITVAKENEAGGFTVFYVDVQNGCISFMADHFCLFAFYKEKQEALILDSDHEVRGETDQVVNMNLKITNNPGIMALNLAVKFDSELIELVGVSDSGLLHGFNSPSNYNGNSYVINWEDGLATNNNTATGTIATLSFRLKKRFDVTSIVISGKGYNADVQSVSVDGVNCKVINTSSSGDQGVQSVSLREHEKTVYYNKSWVMGFNTYPTIVCNGNIAYSVKWSSSNPDIAMIAQEEKERVEIQILSYGKAVITCTVTDSLGNIVADSMEINVFATDIAYFKINDKTIELSVAGGNKEIDYALTIAIGTTCNMRWSSSNDQVVQVDEKGTLIPVSAGTATITCTVTDKYNVSRSDTCTVIVKKGRIHSAHFDQRNVVVKCGDTRKLRVTVECDPGVDYQIRRWFVRDDIPHAETSTICAIDSTGLITALKPGSAYVYCDVEDEYGNTKSCMCEIRIVQIVFPDATMIYKQEMHIPAQILGDEKGYGRVRYESSGGSVMVRDSSLGRVYAARRGQSKVSCIWEDDDGNVLTQTCTVTVKYAWWQILIRIFLLGFIWY